MFTFGIIAENFEVFENDIFDYKVTPLEAFSTINISYEGKISILWINGNSSRR